MKPTNNNGYGLTSFSDTPWGPLIVASAWSAPRYASPVRGGGSAIEVHTCGVYAAGSSEHIATVQLEVGSPLSDAVVWDHSEGGVKYLAPSWLVALLPPAPTVA